MNCWHTKSWPSDSLSTFLADAEGNVRETVSQLPDVYGLLRRGHAIAEKYDQAIKRDDQDELILARFLVIRSHASVLAAARLAMSGQYCESFPLLRASLESALYALHIAKDPAPPDRATVWIRREDSREFKARCRAEFTIARVMASLEAIDSNIVSDVKQYYDLLIDHGAHPNITGVILGTHQHDVRDGTMYDIPIMAPDRKSIVYTLRFIIAVHVLTMKISGMLYSDRFHNLNLDKDIVSLMNDANRMFKSYGYQFNSGLDIK